VLATATGC